MKTKLIFSYGEMSNPIQDDNLLYHYCSMESFVSIIRNKCIWFGNLNSMNDPSELFLKNVNIPQKVLNEYNKNPFEFKHKHNDYENTMQEYLCPSCLEQQITHGGQYSHSLFAFCLSKESNELSQWRLYADNGKGVCLGFNKSKINEFVENNNDCHLQEIHYYNSFEEIISKIAQGILNNIKTMYDNNEHDKLDKYRIDYLHDLVDEWSRFKISDYSHEKETRIVKKVKTSIIANIDAVSLNEVDKNIEIRLRNNELVTYLPINLEDLGLESITLGPTNNNSKSMINLLLAKSGIDIKNNKIYKSTIPYRN